MSATAVTRIGERLRDVRAQRCRLAYEKRGPIRLSIQAQLADLLGRDSTGRRKDAEPARYWFRGE